MILKHGQLLFLEKYSHLRPLESRRPRIAQKRFYLIECIEISILGRPMWRVVLIIAPTVLSNSSSVFRLIVPHESNSPKYT